MRGCAEHLIDFPPMRAQMQESVYHMTLKSHLVCDFHIQNVNILPLENATFLWTSTHKVKKHIQLISIFNPLVDYHICRP